MAKEEKKEVKKKETKSAVKKPVTKKKTTTTITKKKATSTAKKPVKKKEKVEKKVVNDNQDVDIFNISEQEETTESKESISISYDDLSKFIFTPEKESEVEEEPKEIEEIEKEPIQKMRSENLIFFEENENPTKVEELEADEDINNFEKPDIEDYSDIKFEEENDDSLNDFSSSKQEEQKLDVNINKEVPFKKEKKEKKPKEKRKKNHTVLYLAIVLVLVICALGGVMYYKIQESKEKTIVTVGEISFNSYDFMMYFKLAKDDYFKKEVNTLTEEQLSQIVSEENITLKEYLKKTTEDNLKTAGVIQKIAKDNNIVLSVEDTDEITLEKAELIGTLGGQEQFNQWLKTNKTTETSYDNMHKTEKLYNKVYEKLFTEGKENDLTETEKLKEQKKYAKIRQIILLTTDTTTGVSLSETEKEQKKKLADTIYKELEKIDFKNKFNDYMTQYNVEDIKKVDSYSTCVKLEDLVKSLKNAIELLKPGEMSNVVESDYAYHIILKDELDEDYIKTIYENERKEKYSTYILEQKAATLVLTGDTEALVTK